MKTDHSSTKTTGQASQESAADFSCQSRDKLPDKISHLMRNKLQAISGGQFQLETGIKKNDLKAIEAGWSIVKKNQVDLIRCSNHLMALQRLDCLDLEPMRLKDLMFASRQEVESLISKISVRISDKVVNEKSTQEFQLDPFAMRSALIGLIRIASHSETEDLNPIEMELQPPGRIVIKTMAQPDTRGVDPRQSNSSLSIEWEMAEKTVSRHGGILKWNGASTDGCVILDLSEKKMG